MREDDDSAGEEDSKNRGQDEFRSESIAALRAKAQEHSARMLQALNRDTKQTFEESSNSSFDSSFFSDTGETPNELSRQ